MESKKTKTKEIFKFNTLKSNIFFTIFTLIFIVICYCVLFLADEKNIFLNITSVLILILLIIFTIYSWRNKLIIKDKEIIYTGFKKHVILKQDIISIKTDGHRIIIQTKNKKYMFAGYMINKRWNIDINIENNKQLVNYIKEILK